MTASSGEEAILLARSRHFDVIFMDVKMPGMNGVDAFIEIKKTSPKTAVIMVTAYSQEDLLEKSLREGAFSILHKPLDLHQALNIIESVNKPVILIVDDELSFLQSLQGLLEEKRYKVVAAKSGPEAIDSIRHFQFDVALIDVKTPGVDGIETFYEIKRLKSDVKIIIMSGYTNDEIFKQALSNGAYACIHKPIDIDHLLQLINVR